MQTIGSFGDLAVTIGDAHVALAEIRRPPNNFFDQVLIADLADAFEALDADPRCRAIVLASEPISDERWERVPQASVIVVDDDASTRSLAI